ncbi:phytosulfokines 3-like [Prosopis cineraria]|uniref:phytosulfokines 3-like n=1 Tax=Prosopis cineraria TaxID=364024 RepID=UPI002410B500|nr:phytosulfokines 3-like [Prosopis cineraria]
MGKLSVLFFTSIFLCYILTQASRPQPSVLKDSSPETPHLGVESETEHEVTVDERCEGIGDEECLTRRTLAAHVDYIYTQKNKP